MDKQTSETKDTNVPAPRWRPSLRATLIVFVLISLALHAMFGVGGVVTERIARIREQNRIQQARQAALDAALDRKKKAEEKKAATTRAAAAETKKAVEQKLKDEFLAQVKDKISTDAANRLWDQLLAQLMPRIDQLSQDLGDAQMNDADLENQLAQVQGDMLDDLIKELQAEGARRLADQFVDRVTSDVAPKIAEYYKSQINRKIGVGIREAGTKIINEDAATVRAQRLAASQALAKAETQAHAAQTDLTQAKAHLEEQKKAADSATTDAQKAVVASAVKTDQMKIDRAGGELKVAQKALKDAVKGSDALPGNLKKAIDQASAHPAATQASDDAEAASTAVKAGKLPDAAKATDDAAAAVGQFVEAIKGAKALADRDAKENPDAAMNAKVAVKQARDADIKPDLDKKFDDVVVTTAVPRLGKELTDAFKQTLDQAGINDDAVVKDVQAKVYAALGEKVKDDVNAGDAGTKPLTAAEKLDDVNDGPDTGKGGPGKKKGNPGADPNGTDGDGNDTGGDAHQKAIADKINKAASDLADRGMGAIGADQSQDKNFTALAKGNGDGTDGIGQLIQNLGQLVDNVRAGNALGDDGQGTEDGPDGPGGLGHGRQLGIAGSGGSLALGRLSRFNTIDLEHNRDAHAGRFGGMDFDAAQYQKFAATIKERDPASARGQPIQLHGADGSTADITELVAESKDAIRPATLVVPAPPTDKSDGLIGIAEHKEPYRPDFKSVCFANIPYRSKPITLDGDLSEWADVKPLAMYAAGPGVKDHTGKIFPEEVKVQWDNTGFYIAADVKKADNAIVKTVNGTFWEGDGIEFFVDSQNKKDKDRTVVSHQFWAWVDGASNSPLQVGGENIEYGKEDGYVAFGKDLIQVGSKQTATGWRIEVHVPKERFRKLDLRLGTMIGMNVSICTGTNVYYYWAGTTEIATSQRPDTWGDVKLEGSDARVECVDKLAIELKPGEIAKNQSYAKIGQPLRIRVTDPDMNLDNEQKDKLSVSVASRHGKPHQVTLEETANSSGVFEGAIPTGIEIGDSSASDITLYDGEFIDVVYNDQCRADGARDVKVTLSIPTASALTGVAAK